MEELAFGNDGTIADCRDTNWPFNLICLKWSCVFRFVKQKLQPPSQALSQSYRLPNEEMLRGWKQHLRNSSYKFTQAAQKKRHTHTHTHLINLIQITVNQVSWLSWHSCSFVLVYHVRRFLLQNLPVCKRLLKREGQKPHHGQGIINLQGREKLTNICNWIGSEYDPSTLYDVSPFPRVRWWSLRFLWIAERTP